MNAVAVDASVWVAAQDLSDPLNAASRLFFSHTVSSGVTIHVPAFAHVEVACALGRKLRDEAKAQRLANLIFDTTAAKQHAVNTILLSKALAVGSSKFLRGADALYSATAEIVGCDLVSWDKEHIQRAGAVSPDNWVVANP
jgi:predicted nucleic acid-binding protein